MSLVQTDQDVDGEEEVGDNVDEGVNGNEDEEDKNEEDVGRSDVVNQSHEIALYKRRGSKKQLPQKQKNLSDLDWHLTAFLYKSLLAEIEGWRCQCEVLNDVYGNHQISQYPEYLQILPADYLIHRTYTLLL